MSAPKRTQPSRASNSELVKALVAGKVPQHGNPDADDQVKEELDGPLDHTRASPRQQHGPGALVVTNAPLPCNTQRTREIGLLSFFLAQGACGDKCSHTQSAQLEHPTGSARHTKKH